MDLTQAEFSSFNLKSKLQLLRKDGIPLLQRTISDRCKIELYKVYQFYIEVISSDNQPYRVDPVINIDVVDLYADEINIQDGFKPYFGLN
jgi:hypothetical protein